MKNKQGGGGQIMQNVSRQKAKPPLNFYSSQNSNFIIT